MRRDLCYFYPLPVAPVFGAFVKAANERFGKNCKIVDGISISFGLTFSFKYNMNGGSVTAHFMPYQNGTAVNLRYSIAQLMGARYGAHAKDLTQFVDMTLRSSAQPIKLDVNLFLKYAQNPVPQQMPPQQQMPRQQMPPQQMPPQQMPPQQMPPQQMPPQQMPPQQMPPQQMPQQQAPQQAPQQQAPVQLYCSNCGKPLPDIAVFCSNCGFRVKR